MRVFTFLLAAALLSPGPAAASTAREFTELPPGRYSIILTGLISTVCSRAIAAEWAKIPEIESASVDYGKATAHITVRLNRTLQVSALHKALRHAEKLANLDAHYELHDIAYRLVK
ncbi:MAG: hypothetical protein COV48_05375 [Elusimicrobia bacterium CG11_big_fil_rev_8_21_14_0_20_64_6]|nr:MAG: hypothetical protein COV48_05375 [Elusimicrobia bacterium CG11_big_fil_rev_8_21_14_0_20_64_6]